MLKMTFQLESPIKRKVYVYNFFSYLKLSVIKRNVRVRQNLQGVSVTIILGRKLYSIL